MTVVLDREEVKRSMQCSCNPLFLYPQSLEVSGIGASSRYNQKLHLTFAGWLLVYHLPWRAIASRPSPYVRSQESILPSLPTLSRLALTPHRDPVPVHLLASIGFLRGFECSSLPFIAWPLLGELNRLSSSEASGGRPCRLPGCSKLDIGPRCTSAHVYISC